ncbi:MAG: DUF58 domain-containing protein, partial [Cyanobacteria bacterium P01_D01_bin.128]
WHHLQLRTAAPLGLFWSRRYHDGRVNAVVYPTILPLSHCPLLDQLGENSQFQWHQEQRTEAATEGLTRALRPYRWGDPTRLIHWRTSARYGELRVRELEHHTSGQSVTLALDTAATWDTEAFEQAVTALASLYHYALTLNLPVQLWTPKTGLLSERIAVLTTLAGVQIGDGQKGHSPRLPNLPLVWLASRNPDQPLPTGSRQIQWQSAIAPAQMSQDLRITIDPNQPLQPQLQQIL